MSQWLPHTPGRLLIQKVSTLREESYFGVLWLRPQAELLGLPALISPCLFSGGNLSKVEGACPLQGTHDLG